MRSEQATISRALTSPQQHPVGAIDAPFARMDVNADRRLREKVMRSAHVSASEQHRRQWHDLTRAQPR